MEKITKKLVFAYLIIVLLKIALAIFISSPTGFWDEYIYTKVGRSFFYNLNFNIENYPSPFYPPLYSVLLSISYLATDMNLVYLFFKIINSIVSTLVIIPSFWFSKEFLKEKQQFLIPILISLYPGNFSFSNYILSENLFFPLFLFSIFFIFKSLTENNNKNHLLAALCISLSFLTKPIGILLIFVYFSAHIINRIWFKETLKTKNLLLGLVLILLIVSPWVMRNSVHFGFSVYGILGGGADDNINSVERYWDFFILAFLNWIILNVITLALASGIFFFFLSFYAFQKPHDNKLKVFLMLSLVTISAYLIILANNSLGPQPVGLPNIFKFLTSRPIARYFDMLIPLVIIIGTVGLNKSKENPEKNPLKKILLFCIPLFIIGSQLVIYPLLPINNLSLSLLGAIKILVDSLINNSLTINQPFNYIVFFIFLGLFFILPFSILLINKFDFKKIFYLTLILFILTNSINFSFAYYKANIQVKNEQLQIGAWLNTNDPKISNILIDANYKGSPFTNSSALYDELKEKQFLSYIGFWTNDNLYFGNLQNAENMDFFITRNHISNLNLVYKTENIKVYSLVNKI